MAPPSLPKPDEYNRQMLLAILEHWDRLGAVAEDEFNEALLAMRCDVELRLKQMPEPSAIIARTIQLAGGVDETVRIEAATGKEVGRSLYDLLHQLNVRGLN